MKVTDLTGSVTTDAYKDQIGLLSLSHSLNLNCFSGGGTEGRTSGVCNHADISITKVMDKNSVKFNEWCCNAHLISSIVITICRQKGDSLSPVVVYTLSDSLVSSYNVSAGGGNPVESLTFNYAKIKWEFTEQSTSGAKSGNVSASWDLQKNTPQS
jgi:type VI secretion system secreted protein Hcp